MEGEGERARALAGENGATIGEQRPKTAAGDPGGTEKVDRIGGRGDEASAKMVRKEKQD
jgi:hypothetical protein